MCRSKQIILVILSIVLLIPVPVFAVEYDEDFYSSNDILFYDPRATDTNCSANNTDSTAVTVEMNAAIETSLKYFTGKGFSLMQAAAIAGNLQQESKFNPTATNKIGAYGIAQWLSGRKQNLQQKANYNTLDTQLEFIWEELNGGEKQSLASLLSYSGNSPKELAIVFGESYERYGSNEQGNRSSYAQSIYDRFKGTIADGSGVSLPTGVTVANSGDGNVLGDCGGALGGVSSIDDAVAWANKFIDDTEKQYPGEKGSHLNQISGQDKILYQWRTPSKTYCWGASGCEECVAVAGWFVTNMTDYRFTPANGIDVVARLGDNGAPTGSEPRPFSVFSQPSSTPNGHTGVVLGVLQDGSVITLENNSGGDGKTRIRQRTMPSTATYAYVGDKLKGAAAGLAGSTP